jgi:hypothetical protein
MMKRRTAEIVGLMVVVHLLEDATILSIGRFLPVPVWLMYPIGMGVSAIILTGLFQKLMNRWRT